MKPWFVVVVVAVVATTEASAQVGLLMNTSDELIRFNAPGTSAPAWSIQRNGGNQRGQHAVDLQSYRDNAAQVASGDFSVVSGGGSNTASSGGSVVSGGGGNTASGLFSVVSGGSSNTAGGAYSTVAGGYNLKVGNRSFGFSGQILNIPTDLSASSNITAFVDVDLWLYNVRNQASQLRLYEPSTSSDGSANYTAFRAQTQTSDIVYTLPASVTAGGVLQTDGSGNLSWVNPSTLVSSAETDPQVGTLSTGQVAFWDGSALTGSSNLFWDNTNARLGVGTSSPSVSLDVTGSVRLASAASTTVVIGNVTADGKLRVDGSIRADGYRSADGSASTPAYRFTNSASTGMFSPGANQLGLATAGTERFRIDASGNVSITGGHVALGNTDNTARELRFQEPSGSGSEYTAFRAQAQSANITYTLPASITAGGVLRTDAGGLLSWQLVDDDPSNDLTTSTTFSGDVSGPYNNLQLGSGVVGTTELAGGAVTSAKIADGTITNTDISSTAAIAVSKLAAGSEGQVLVTQGGVPQWASISVGETDPEVSVTTTGAIPRWSGSALVDGSLSDDGAGTLSRSGSIAINPGVTNTLSTDGSLAVGQSLTVGTDLVVGGTTILGSLSAATTTAIVTNDNTAAALVVANSGSGGLISFAGTSGPYALTLASPTLTADRVWTLPDLSGTVTLYTNIPSTGQVLTWNGTSAQWQSPAGGSGWSLTGNSSTDPSTNFLGTTDSQPLVIRTGNTERMRVTAAGSLQFVNSSTGNTASDGFLIELSGTNIQLRQNENAEIQFRTNASSGTDTVKMRLLPDGKLAFFTGAPSYRIDLPNNSATNVGRIRAQGYANYSSRAWKDDIEPLADALGKVLRLQGVRFRWKPQYGGTRDIGFVMEDVAPIVPEVVDRDPKTGEYLGMDYSRLTALLVEALKEEHRRNEELRARVEEQNRRNEELRAELAQLRTMIEQLAAGQPITAGAATTTVRLDGQWLGQNIPNPHDGTTTIPYYVPSGVGRAQLEVSDAAGRTVRTIELPAREQWASVTLEMGLLSSGTYEYRLLFDGRIVATKQMQLVK